MGADRLQDHARRQRHQADRNAGVQRLEISDDPGHGEELVAGDPHGQVRPRHPAERGHTVELAAVSGEEAQVRLVPGGDRQQFAGVG